MAAPACAPSRGFTLMELMVTVAIVALLAAVAYPGYQAQMRKGRRSDAKQALLDLAARQERFSTVNNRWASTPGDLGYSATAFPLDVMSGGRVSYQLFLDVDNSAGSYTATAAPRGLQVDDGCGSFQLDHMGVQTVNGSAADCW